MAKKSVAENQNHNKVLRILRWILEWSHFCNVFFLFEQIPSHACTGLTGPSENSSKTEPHWIKTVSDWTNLYQLCYFKQKLHIKHHFKWKTRRCASRKTYITGWLTTWNQEMLAHLKKAAKPSCFSWMVPILMSRKQKRKGQTGPVSGCPKLVLGGDIWRKVRVIYLSSYLEWVSHQDL